MVFSQENNAIIEVRFTEKGWGIGIGIGWIVCEFTGKVWNKSTIAYLLPSLAGRAVGDPSTNILLLARSDAQSN
jgi:hypothetical protein